MSTSEAVILAGYPAQRSTERIDSTSGYRGAWKHVPQSLATGFGATYPDVALCMYAKPAIFRDSLREQPQDVGHTWPMGIEPTEQKRWCLMREN